MSQHELRDEMTGDPVNFCWICDALFDTFELFYYDGQWVCQNCIEDNELEFTTEEDLCFCGECHNWKLEGF